MNSELGDVPICPLTPRSVGTMKADHHDRHGNQQARGPWRGQHRAELYQNPIPRGMPSLT